MDSEVRKKYINMPAKERDSWDWEVVCYRRGGVMSPHLVVPVIRQRSQPDAGWFYANDLTKNVKTDIETFIDTPVSERNIGSGSFIVLESPVAYDPTKVYVHVPGGEKGGLLNVMAGDKVLDAYLAMPE